MKIERSALSESLFLIFGDRQENTKKINKKIYKINKQNTEKTGLKYNFFLNYEKLLNYLIASKIKMKK